MHDMLETAGGADVFADVKRQSVQVVDGDAARARAGGDHRSAPRGESGHRRASPPNARSGKDCRRCRQCAANRIYILADDRLNTPGPSRGRSRLLRTSFTRSPDRPMHCHGSIARSPIADDPAVLVVGQGLGVGAARAAAVRTAPGRRAADDVQRRRRSRRDARGPARHWSRNRPKLPACRCGACRFRRRVPNEIYEERMREATSRAAAAGFTHVAFGDLFLEDVRRYREERLAGTGLTPLFPLWGQPTDVLAREMLAGGLDAILTCVDPARARRPFRRPSLRRGAARRSARAHRSVRRARRVSHLLLRGPDVLRADCRGNRDHRRARRVCVC